MEGVILRLSLVYGVGWKGNLLALLKAIDKNRMLPMPNVGNRKSMVSVQDACQAARIAATITLTEHRIFIISDGVPYSTDQIYHLMRKALGKRQISFSVPLCLWRYFGYVGDLLQRVCKINLPIHSEKIEKLFASSWYDMNDYTVLTGYVPQYTLSDVLPDIVRDYRENLCKEC